MATDIDPIKFEVIRNALTMATEEMATTLRRSAYSTNVKTRQDFSCAFFDKDLRGGLEQPLQGFLPLNYFFTHAFVHHSHPLCLDIEAACKYLPVHTYTMYV